MNSRHDCILSVSEGIFGGNGSWSSINKLDFVVPYSFWRELIEAFLSEDFGEFGIFLGYAWRQYGLCTGSSEDS